MKLLINSQDKLAEAIGAIQRTSSSSPEKPSLNEALSYCPETGLLTWRVARGRCAAGSPAGCDTERGYISVRVNSINLYAHRVAFEIMTGRKPEFIDHINGVRSDNRWINLREVTRSENGMNMKKPATNRSGVIGVFWNTGKGKWTARIKINQKTKHLGDFNDFKEAVTARKDAEQELGFHRNHGRCI